MKNVFKICWLILLILSINLITSCKKNKPTLPVVTTAEVTGISTTTAVSGGYVTDDGGEVVISKGVCWNTLENPVIDNNKTSEAGGSDPFTSYIAQLAPNTLYYIRAYATNSVGTGYGSIVSFKTLGDKPTSTSADASDILIYSATLNGTVNSNSLSTVVTFEYGVTTLYGGSVPAVQSPLTGITNNKVSIGINNLLPGTTYHFRIKSENQLGIIYSEDHTLSTLGQKPTLSTFALTELRTSTVVVKATVNPNYLLSTLTIEYGITNNYGSSANPVQSSLTGSTAINVNTSIAGLTPGTKYYFRVKIQNDLGITYGEGNSFTTFNVMDIDNNGYYSINIGSQEWITKNLITTHFQNGDPIPIVTLDYDWSGLTSAGYCLNKNDNLNSAIYGNLYNFYVAKDSRNVCPAGWHVPSLNEWHTLVTFLGGDSIADESLRETGTTHWLIETGATNLTGFTLLPAGEREADGSFFNLHYNSYIWSSFENYENTAQLCWNIGLSWNTSKIYWTPYSVTYGASIRCLK